MLAHQLMMLEGQAVSADVVNKAALPVPGADRLLAIGLANYAAGALLMPYAPFREAAREVRHDIDRLARRFGVSFEQACHRLSTLQRPGLRGIPFFFCRVDMAGNITKRHSATRLQFARRSEEHTSELQSLMRISYAVFCLKKKRTKTLKCPQFLETTIEHNIV